MIALTLKYGIEKGELSKEVETLDTIETITNSAIYFAFLIVYMIILRLLTTRLRQ